MDVNQTSDQELKLSPEFTELRLGDLAPRFTARGAGYEKYLFDSAAGRYLVLCFYGSTSEPRGQEAVNAMLKKRDRFDDDKASFFGISLDPADEAREKVQRSLPGVRYIWDFDGKVSQQYGALSTATNLGAVIHAKQFWMIVDPTLRILAKFPFGPEGQGHEKVFNYLDALPHPNLYAGFEMPAPILVIPNVFEAKICQELIQLYDEHGGAETGVMRKNSAGKVAGVLDGNFKRRKDFTVENPELIKLLQNRIVDRVLPDIERLFFMKITRMERYIVGCYAAEDGGHFLPHRDNSSNVTAHRRYAVSINLNSDFEGGEVSFPEYSRKGHKAPRGWAVVFPCAILHAVSKVTRGRRYAFLPFVYDESGRRIRDQHLDEKGEESC